MSAESDATRVYCSKEARAMLSRHKESPETFDDVIRKLVTFYEDRQGGKHD